MLPEASIERRAAACRRARALQRATVSRRLVVDQDDVGAGRERLAQLLLALDLDLDLHAGGRAFAGPWPTAAATPPASRRWLSLIRTWS